MKKVLFLLLTIALICCTQREKIVRETTFHHNAKELKDVKKQIESTGLLRSLSQYVTDSLKKEECFASLDRIKSIINEKWKADTVKLIVNCYAEKGNLSRELLVHSSQLNALKTSDEIPKRLKDSFDAALVYHPGDYWYGLGIRQSAGFAWDTLETKMMVQVLQVR